MRHLAYSVTYSVVPINSSLLTITLFCLVITTLVYNGTKCSVPFMMLYRSSNIYIYTREYITYTELTPWSSHLSIKHNPNFRKFFCGSFMTNCFPSCNLILNQEKAKVGLHLKLLYSSGEASRPRSDLPIFLKIMSLGCDTALPGKGLAIVSEKIPAPFFFHLMYPKMSHSRLRSQLLSWLHRYPYKCT
jgi:hypothetical protein